MPSTIVGHCFEIKGWNERYPIEARFATKAEIEYSRRIIADEVRGLDDRLPALEASLHESSPLYKKYLRSKQWPTFALSFADRGLVTAGDSGNGIAGIGADTRSASKTAQRQESGSTLADWLISKCAAASTIVTVGGSGGHSTRLSVAGHRLVHVMPGEGRPQPSFCGMPERHRPGLGSFAALLVQSAENSKSQPAAYVLASGATPLDAELLRQRLGPGQHVAVARDSSALDVVRASFDAMCIELDDGFVFTEPGHGITSWPKISVVTVSFNQAKYLERCLESVLGQKYPNLEYIVIDACSSDGSHDILRRYEPHLSRLVIERDEGQSDGLNKGFDLATGDILTWINSDDELAPGALLRAVATFQRFGVDMVVGGCERIDSEDRVDYCHFAALPYCRPVPLGYAHQLMWQGSWEKGDYFFQPEVLFTADIWRRSGGYLKKHLYWAMDWELWIRMALAGASIVQIPAVIGRSREHPEQKTTGEELYLYQLRSILLEHDDALRGLEGYATELPAGEPITTMPHRPAEATSAGGASHWEVRSAGDPGRIALAVHQLLLQITIQARSNRARLKTVAARVLGRSRIERLRFHIERLKEIALARHYNFAGVRLVDAVSYARMKRAAEMLHDYEAETRARRYALSEEKRRFESQSNKITDRITALLLTILGVPRNPKIQDRVDALYKNGLDIVEIARTLAVDNFEFQQNPQFARSRHLLVQRNDWPLAARGVEVIGPISIVDIGAEPLAYESHIYEPLRSRWPTRVLGFDPFSTADETTAAETKSNGVVTELTILPHFIGSGHEATFHINRSAPTSSLFASNLELAKRFSLLDQSLETVATRQVGTRTLDAALAGRFGFEQSVDFLKIDVQGGTLDILTAAPEVLARTLVCQVEVEFAELYKGEGLFGAVHEIMADHSFGLLDFADLGRQRYAVMDQSRTYFLNAGRLLWADSIYVRHLDDLGQHRPESLLKIAIIMHEVYLKYDVAAEALHFYDNKTGSKLAVAYASAIV